MFYTTYNIANGINIKDHHMRHCRLKRINTMQNKNNKDWCYLPLFLYGKLSMTTKCHHIAFSVVCNRWFRRRRGSHTAHACPIMWLFLALCTTHHAVVFSALFLVSCATHGLVGAGGHAPLTHAPSYGCF
jgi:hypothetical protein